MPDLMMQSAHESRRRLESVDPGLVDNLFQSANVNLRGEVLSQLGWRVYRTEGDLADDVLRRLQDLWEWRVGVVRDSPDDAELRGFGWWFLSGRFDVYWALDHLLLAASAHSPLDNQLLVFRELDKHAESFPLECIRIFAMFLAKPDRDWLLLELGNHAVRVVAIVLDSDDPGLRQEGLDLLESLGRAGLVNAKPMVEELLARRRHAHGT